MAARHEVAPLLLHVPPAPGTKLSPGPGRLAGEVAAHQRARIHRAMIEIAGARGFEAVTVRDLAQLAGVSTRACYTHFGSKEECFLRTHELVAKRILRSIATAEADAHDGAQRVRLAFGAFTDELARDPRAARVFLLEPYVVGPEALAQLRCTMRALEERVAVSFADASGGTEPPERVIEAVVAGVERTTRARLLAGREQELSQLGDSLAQWALLYGGVAAADLAGLDRRFMSRGSTMELSQVPSSDTDRVERRARSPQGDRALLLSAVARLAAAKDDEQVTVSHIRSMAGLTRGRFDAHFVSAEDCFFAALEERLREVLARAKEAEELGRTWAGGLYRAAEMICAEVAADRLFAGLCFGRVAEAAKARAASVERRERLLAEVTAHIREDAPAESYPGDLEVEASLEAACALLGAKAAGGGSAAGGSAPPVAATVAYLVLAPLIGPDATLATIREEVAAESGLSEGPWLETAS